MQLLLTRLKLVATVTAPACARAFVNHTLRSWLLQDLVEAAELVVSELVTNAVRATGTTVAHPTYADLERLALLGVQVRVSGESLIIEVWDNDAEEQVLCPSGETHLGESGRGLAIVQALGTLGVLRTQYGGKIVWAELPGGAGISAVQQFQPTPPPRGYGRTVFSGVRQPDEHAICDQAFTERLTDHRMHPQARRASDRPVTERVRSYTPDVRVAGHHGRANTGVIEP